MNNSSNGYLGNGVVNYLESEEIGPNPAEKETEQDFKQQVWTAQSRTEGFVKAAKLA